MCNAIPKPLTSGHLCSVCKGTGCDAARTRAMYKEYKYSTGYIICRICNGRGIDAAEYFNWSTKPASNPKQG